MRYRRQEEKSRHERECDRLVAKAKKYHAEKWNGLYKTRLISQ